VACLFRKKTPNNVDFFGLTASGGFRRLNSNQVRSRDKSVVAAILHCLHAFSNPFPQHDCEQRSS
jgi:hypothetical protein